MTVNRLAAPETCDVDIAPPSTAWRCQVNGGQPTRTPDGPTAAAP
jgi:hypothetical protein